MSNTCSALLVTLGTLIFAVDFSAPNSTFVSVCMSGVTADITKFSNIIVAIHTKFSDLTAYTAGLIFLTWSVSLKGCRSYGDFTSISAKFSGGMRAVKSLIGSETRPMVMDMINGTDLLYHHTASTVRLGPSTQRGSRTSSTISLYLLWSPYME